MSKRTAIQKKSATVSLTSRVSKYLSVERVIVGGTVLLTLAIVGVIGLNSIARRPIDIEGVEQFPVLGSHSESLVIYNETPPVGGPHAPVWQNCGVYLEPVKDEAAVHSLEHGAIWMTYRPDLPDTEVERLREITWQSNSRLLSPYPDLPSPIVMSAWGYQLQLESADDERLAQFIRQYERASSAPEPRGFCNGGEGQPFTQFSG